jgi:hypothetical protein
MEGGRSNVHFSLPVWCSNHEYFEREKLNIEEKVIGMCFHMHVLKTTTQEE